MAASTLCLFLAGFGGSVLLVALPAVGAEFHAETPRLARLGATLALGSALAVPLSVVADRWRRGPMAAIGIVGFSLAALVSASASSLTALAAARFAAVCFEALVAALATAAAVEAVAAEHRARTTGLLALGSGAGAALTVVAYPLLAPHWRSLYLAAGCTGVLLAPTALLLPGRGAAGRGAREILRRPWRGRLGLLAAAAALGGLLYEPANFFTVLFGSGRLHLSPAAISAILAGSGIAAALGFIVGGIVSDRAGRRYPGAILLVSSAALAALSFSGTTGLYVAAGIAWSAVAGAATPVVGAWTAELVPSRARVTAYATVGVAGALGGVLGLQLVGNLSATLGLPTAIWVTGVPALLGAALLLALPETGGIPLPD